MTTFSYKTRNATFLDIINERVLNILIPFPSTELLTLLLYSSQLWLCCHLVHVFHCYTFQENCTLNRNKINKKKKSVHKLSQKQIRTTIQDSGCYSNI